MKKEHGFTLVELMIALVVMVVGIIAVMQVFLLARRTNATAEDIALATTAVSDRFERLRLLDVDTDPAVQPGGDLDNDVAGYSDTYSTPGGLTLRVRWRVYDTATTPVGEQPPPSPWTRVVIVRAFPPQGSVVPSRFTEVRSLLVDED